MEEAALSLNDEVLKAGERGMALCVPRGGRTDSSRCRILPIRIEQWHFGNKDGIYDVMDGSFRYMYLKVWAKIRLRTCN